MTISLKCALIQPNERSELIFSIAHYRAQPLHVLFGTQQQKKYYEDALINLHYRNLTFSTFAEYVSGAEKRQEIVVIADVPHVFQLLSDILKKTEEGKNQAILLLLKLNKKYLNMISKKLSIKAEIMEYSHNKFVGINDKLREFVEKSYDLNRAGFYAYGSYINYFRSNLLKKIFRTDQIDVALLSKSFGFITPPRVKEGNFLTEKARNERKAEKARLRKIKEAEKLAEAPKEQVKKVKKVKKIKKVQK